MAEKLTDGIIAGLTCPPGKRDALYFDSTLRGFAVRVTSAGTRTLLLQYKQAGRTRRVVLGTWGAELTASQARRKAEQMRGRVREGRDPAGERVAADKAARAVADRNAFTVATLIDRWRDLHLVERAASYRLVTSRMLKTALDAYLAKPSADFPQAAAVALLDDIKARRGPIAANRVRAAGRACWAWAVARGDLEANPWAATPKPARERSRERVLTDEELGAVWRAAEGLGHPWRPIMMLLILTGQRRQEVAGLAWSELDLEAATWTIPRERAKNHQTHIVPLLPEVVNLIRSVPRADGAKLVFENDRGTAPSGFGRMKERLGRALGADFVPWTLHDLRRTCATGMQKLGVSLPIIEAVLNHVSGSRGGIVGVYQRHDWATEKRDALTRWTQHVAGLRKAEKPKADAERKKLGRGVDSAAAYMRTYAGMIDGKGGKAIAGQQVRDGDLDSAFLESEAKAIEKRKQKLKSDGYDLARSNPLDLAMAEETLPDFHKDGFDYQAEVASELAEIITSKIKH